MSSLKPRRRPSQSRAWMTSIAIQDAFLIRLVESGYDQVSIREIAALAGVGLGTLYLYFPNKESLAAVTVRRWLRNLARDMEGRAAKAQQLHQRIDALVVANLDAIYTAVPQWRALLTLERRITEPALYRQMYQFFVHMVARVLAAASDWPVAREAQPVAFLLFSLLCSATRDALLVLDELPERALWQAQLQAALQAAMVASSGTR